MAKSQRLLQTAAVLTALLLLAASPALAKDHKPTPDNGAEKVNSVAYPKAPGGMPAAGDKGKPVAPKAEDSAKPAPPAEVTTEAPAQKVGTPSTAYPGAPGDTPAAGDAGKPVKP